MKTSPVYPGVIGLALILSGAALAQPPAGTPAWKPLQIDQTVAPIFPLQLLQWGVTRGRAEIAVSTDAAGRLEDLLAVGYTRPEFADAAITAIRHWKFDPARLRGEPVGTTVQLDFRYTAEGVVVSSATINDTMEIMLARLLAGSHAYGTCSRGKLDRMPTPVTTVAPQYSQQLAERGIKGSVTVEFYIDESGAVRLPAVVSHADDPFLGALAVEALRQWKFMPATAGGRPVLVRASQAFVFGNGG